MSSEHNDDGEPSKHQPQSDLAQSKHKPEEQNGSALLAQTMGFSAFGGVESPDPGTAKRRKLDSPTLHSKPSMSEGTGPGRACSLPLLSTAATHHPPAPPHAQPPLDEAGRSALRKHDVNDNGARVFSKEELTALERGVQNEKGDIVFFKPSFVQDPWA